MRFRVKRILQGGKVLRGAELKRTKKRKKQKERRGEWIGSSRCDVVIQLLFFRGTRGSPLSYLPSFYFLLF
jgi:hypothetical protein